MIDSNASYTNARKQLISWGAITAVIYIAYLIFFPLLPAVEENA